MESRVRYLVGGTVLTILALLYVPFPGIQHRLLPEEPGPIVMIDPVERQIVPAAFYFEGSADNSWFGDGALHTILYAPDADLLWEGPAYSQDDWMTTKMVRFSGSIDAGSYRGPATINIYRGNESDDRSYDAVFSVSVIIQ